MARICPLIPARGKVIIRGDEAEQVTPGGIHLPDKAQEKPVSGIVVEVGAANLVDGKEITAQDFFVNSTVYFSRYSGSEIDVDGETYLVLNQEDILAFRKK